MDKYFRLLKQNKILFILPMVFDFCSLFFGTYMMGFWGEPTLTFKLALHPGLPTIASILEHNVLASGISPAHPLAGMVLLTSLVFLLVGSFLQAGYIGWLWDVARGGETSGDALLAYGRRYWLRMLIVYLFMLMLSFVGFFLATPLLIVGMMLFMAGLIIFKVYFVYWEFTIVTENLSVGDAFFRCLNHFANRTPATARAIWHLLALGLGFGLLVNFLWHPITVYAAIIAYNYLAAGLQLALMDSFILITEQQN